MKHPHAQLSSTLVLWPPQNPANQAPERKTPVVRTQLSSTAFAAPSLYRLYAAYTVVLATLGHWLLTRVLYYVHVHMYSKRSST